ncbi:hypothetical protein GCM10027321_18870 [Massilia terrae]|uniref:DUF4136 domain-containing protein n=1 Tax=Massilia terrae TaxID=1811224 RepID=A0ABT2CWK4_9BURK|nr:DUF4136 domain-containing protein [Massilia terrae]MCS0658348.1 DUF4136 domain-containing protein [Massilia terrae]
MKRLLILVAASMTLLLAGCATTVSSHVTTFNQWPAQLSDKSYAFERVAPQQDSLELHSYQELVRAQLAQLGFHDSGADKPALLVSMRFMTTDVPVRVLQAADPFWTGPYPRFYSPYRRYWGGWYGPYDPLWGPPYSTRIDHQYHRVLHVTIRSAADGKRLFEVTVKNTSDEESTPAIMPAMVQSAFQNFPGPNGGSRVIELKQQSQG